jgi:hypothetical protein
MWVCPILSFSHRTTAAQSWLFSLDLLSKSNSWAGKTSSANPQSKQTEMGWQTDTGGTRTSLISGELAVNSPSTRRMFSDLHALQAIFSDFAYT